MCCVSEDATVDWFVGNLELQCEKGECSHWHFGVNHWGRASAAEVERVHGVRAT